jgi:methylated-DNA-protein-cysteine methyltransferase-like protein
MACECAWRLQARKVARGRESATLDSPCRLALRAPSTAVSPSPPPTCSHQRVISAKGIISPRGDGGLGVARQRERLEAEGVEVETVSGLGERINVRTYGWFPERGEQTLDAWLEANLGPTAVGD